MHDREIDFAGPQQIDIFEGSIGLNDFDRDPFFFGNLLDVLSDLEVSPFGGTRSDGQCQRVTVKQ